MVKLSCSNFRWWQLHSWKIPRPPRAAKKVVLGQGAFKGFLGMYIPQNEQSLFFWGFQTGKQKPRGMTGWMKQKFFHSCRAFFWGGPMTPKDLAKDDPFLGSEVGGVA